MLHYRLLNNFSRSFLSRACLKQLRSMSSIYISRKMPDVVTNKFNIAGLKYSMWDSDEAMERENLHSKLSQLKPDGFFCTLADKIDAELLDICGPQLRVVSSMSVGLDHVDLSACAARHIRVGHTPDVLTDAVATLAVALLLSVQRRLPEAADAVRDGKWRRWRPFNNCTPTLHGATVGVVGLGRIGEAAVRRLAPFGVGRFLYCGPTPKPEAEARTGAEYAAFHDLLSASDYVLVTCALTPATQGLFDARAFGLMRPSAVFVNVSRGDVVRQEDLVAALEAGRVAAAGLDVTTPEPLPPDHALLRLPNCLVLPHIGSAERDTRLAMAGLAADNVIAGLAGGKMPAEWPHP